MGWGGSCRGGWGGSCKGVVGHVGVGWGGVGHSGVNGENNRCYSYLSQMQNDAN